jgi:hypothetical protein
MQNIIIYLDIKKNNPKELGVISQRAVLLNAWQLLAE